MPTPHDILPILLGVATLLPLASFFVIFALGRWLGKAGAWIAIGAILSAGVLSFVALLGVWLPEHFPQPAAHGEHGESDSHGAEQHQTQDADAAAESPSDQDAAGESTGDAQENGAPNADDHHAAGEKPAYSGIYYPLGEFLGLELNISYYIDTLTVCMFCMVTLIATLIHFYATGYMHDELHLAVEDHEITLEDGTHPKRPGRYPRFFQYLSLFCFSMLGLVLAGNIAMVFVFWELVGICSYFLIGFYIERKSASNAANKAFIVNRIGDFGMIIGLMALWSGIGTFAFGDYETTIAEGPVDSSAELREGHLPPKLEKELAAAGIDLPDHVHVYAAGDESWMVEGASPAIVIRREEDRLVAARRSLGMFSQVRPAEDEHRLRVPDRMVRHAASDEVAAIVADLPQGTSGAEREAVIAALVPVWRRGESPRESKQYKGWLADVRKSMDGGGEVPEFPLAEGAEPGGPQQSYGYWLLIVAGVGIFCGCVGKSAQFPLHTWLPDAMEGPTPVSALVHSATMVAAGVYLVGRFYPVFAPEVLLVIAVIGCITLFMAATIAITATDIKRVLAYSTVSQLGYMMLALGLGGWAAGLMHLITHAFFKSLLFMGSGSVIHAVHTNEMPLMGGLFKKMPYTAITMLIGCLAIAGVGLPLIVVGGSGIGFSGFYSKDAILEQGFLFMQTNGAWSALFFAVATGAAAITAFYMFRLWFMTFTGKPRDAHRYDHAHESPRVMYVPLIVLAVFAVGVAWSLPSFLPGSGLSLAGLLEQARPPGTLDNTDSAWLGWQWPDEHASHEMQYALPVTLAATGTWIIGIGLAAAFYWLRYLDAADAGKTFAPIHRFLINKWWFDELYNFLFVRPLFVIAGLFSAADRRLIDGFIDRLAAAVKWFASAWDAVADRTLIDGTVNVVAGWIWSLGLGLRDVQTGRIRQYVMFIVVGAIAIFILISFFFGAASAG